MGVRGMSKARGGGGEGGDLKSMEERKETWVRLKRWARKRKVEESGV